MVEVDEENLTSIILSLLDKITVNSSDRKTLQLLYTKAKDIALIELDEPTVQDMSITSNHMPLDTVLGTEITPERREEIYTQIIEENNAL